MDLGEDLIFQIGDFFMQQVVRSDDKLPLEIEAKIGRIVQKGNAGRSERIRLPYVGNEVWLRGASDFAFESQMTEGHHKHINEFLNHEVQQSHQPRSDGKPRVPIHYVHHREADAFYELPPSELESLDPLVISYQQQCSQRLPRVRITRDTRTSEIIAKVIKIRIQDLNVFCPNWPFDYRVSVSAEFPWEGNPDVLEEYATLSTTKRHPRRNKDRMSYTHQFCRIDLTQVKIGVQPGGKSEAMSHELEVEMDVETTRSEGKRLLEGAGSHYAEFIKVFIDNVRTLAKSMNSS